MNDEKNKKINMSHEAFQTIFNNPYDRPEYEEDENFSEMRAIFELKKSAALSYELGLYDFNMLEYTRKVEFYVLDLMLQELRAKRTLNRRELYLHFKKIRDQLKQGGGIKQVEDKLGLRGLKERVRNFLQGK